MPAHIAILENYIAAIVKECIEYDPGILIGTPHVIDGLIHKKQGVF